MPRTFVALPLPDPQRALLAAHLGRCAEVAPDFRWVAADTLHLTLRFIGSVDDAALARVTGGLRGIREDAFEVRLGDAGTFGGGLPSVVWLGLATGREGAARLAAACESVCRAAGLEPDGRPFRPHLTLARARVRRGGAPLPELPPPPAMEPWAASEFILYESRLQGGRPPEYVPLECFPLRTPPFAARDRGADGEWPAN